MLNVAFNGTFVREAVQRRSSPWYTGLMKNHDVIITYREITRSEIREVVAEVMRAINAWYYTRDEQ